MKKAIKTYHVRFRMYGIASMDEGIDVTASSKAEAYDKAVWEMIPKKCGSLPYSAWVQSVTYNNGNYKLFNTSEGNAY